LERLSVVGYQGAITFTVARGDTSVSKILIALGFLPDTASKALGNDFTGTRVPAAADSLTCRVLSALRAHLEYRPTASIRRPISYRLAAFACIYREYHAI